MIVVMPAIIEVNKPCMDLPQLHASRADLLETDVESIFIGS